MDKYHDCGHRLRNTDKRKRKREVESNTPETQKVFAWFYSRNGDRVSSFVGINRVQARMERLERERDEAREATLAAQFERDQWRMRCAELQNGVVTEAAK